MDADVLDFLSFVTVKKGLTRNSIKHVRVRYKIFYDWLKDNNYPLTRLSVEKFLLYLREVKQLKNASLNTYVFFFRYLDSYLKDRGLDLHLTEGLQSFKKERPYIDVLTTMEIKRILNCYIQYGKFGKIPPKRTTEYLNFMYLTLTELLATTGCRIEEALELKVKYINTGLNKVTFMLTKNHENRTVDISASLLERIQFLNRNKFPDDYVFTSLTGHKVSVTSFEDDLKKRAAAAGVNKRIYPHLFRHSFATQLLKDGVDITMVATILGHKDIQTTFQSYIHLASDQIKRAMFRHQLLRDSIEPGEVLKQIKDDLEKYHLDDDSRFDFEINTKNGELTIKLKVR